MHAYAMDANGARKLRKHIDVCSINPLDIQIQNACKNHNITWSLSCPDDVGESNSLSFLVVLALSFNNQLCHQLSPILSPITSSMLIRLY